MNLRKFIKDAGSNYAIYSLQLLIGLLQVPIFLNTYGSSLYGIYLLSIGTASSILFLQFGSGQTILRYVAEYLEDGDEAKYSHAITVCSLLTGGSSLFALLIFMLIAVWHDSIFSIPPEYTSQSFWLFFVAGIYSFVLFLAQLPRSMVKGAGIFYARNQLTLIEIAVRAVIVALVYFFAISIYWVLLGEILTSLIALFFDLLMISRSKRALLSVNLFRLPPNRRVFSGEVWRYAKQTFLLSIVSFFSQGSDRLLIALFLDVRFVTIYSVITRPFGILKSLLSMVFVVLNPVFVSILKRSGRAKLQSYVDANAKILVLCVGLMAILSALTMPDLYRLWLGSDEYRQYSIYTQGLIILLTVRSVTSLHNNALYTVGETGPLLRISVYIVSLNLLISVILTPLIGIAGVLIGTFAQLLFTGPLILSVMYKFVKEKKDGSMFTWHVFTALLSILCFLLIISAQSTYLPVEINRISFVAILLIAVVLALAIARQFIMRRRNVEFD